MYLVIELQKTDESTLLHLATAYSDLNEAVSKFHQILSYAAVSSVLQHGAVILSERGNVIKTETFTHPRPEPEPEPVPEEEPNE